MILRSVTTRCRLAAGPVLGVLLTGMALLSPSTPAFGHASLVRSDPPPNVLLEARPKVLRLWYGEDVAPGLSVVSILDRSNLVVERGGVVDARDAKLLELPLERLRPGIYTVSWKVLSSVDGHITRGAFAFTFLPPGTDPAILLERGSVAFTRRGLGQSLFFCAQALAGWVHLIALFVGVGGLHFPLVVLGIGRRSECEALAARQRLLDPAMALAAKAFTTALFSGALWWEISTHVTSDTSLAHFLFRPALLPYLLAPRTSQSVILRMFLLLLALVFLHEARRTSPPSLLLLGYCEAVGAVTLLGIALSSHSAATWTSPLAMFIDTLHLWAAALWLGGLALMAITFPALQAEGQSKEWLPLLLVAMRRFTPWAAGSVGVLLVTGIFQVSLHIPRPQSLWQTMYGLVLSLKLLLLLPMLLLGAVSGLMARSEGPGNQTTMGGIRRRMFEIAGRVQEYGAEWLRSRQWAVRGEVTLGAGILLCAAVLTQLPPPRAASLAPPPTTLDAQGAGLAVALTIASAEGLLAPSDLIVRIRQADGRDAERISRVTIKQSMPGMEMNVSPLLASPLSGGEYRAKTLLSMLGRWEFAVVVRRKGVEDDAVFRFPYVLLDVAGAQTEVGPALPERLSLRAAWSTPSSQWRLLVGASLVVLGLGIASGLGVRAVARHRRAVLPCLAGLAFLLFGGYQMVNAMVVDTTPTAWQENPVPSDASSLARGRALYVADCATCHGEAGRGVGPPGLAPIPPALWRADLTGNHMEAHSDGDLFWWISKGIRGTPMPAFEDSLRPQDRWHLVNYVRSLRRTTQASP